MADMFEANARDQLRRDLTRQINTVLRQKHEKETWLAQNKGAVASSRIIASCEIASLRLQYTLLQDAMFSFENDQAADSVLAPGANGSVQGQGMWADPCEFGTARLVKAIREAASIKDMPLPWAWSFERGKNEMIDHAVVTAYGRYMVMGGGHATSRMVAYLARAGALFPSLVREVIALRIALIEADTGRTSANVAGPLDYMKADALIRKPTEPPWGS